MILIIVTNVNDKNHTLKLPLPHLVLFNLFYSRLAKDDGPNGPDKPCVTYVLRAKRAGYGVLPPFGRVGVGVQ